MTVVVVVVLGTFAAAPERFRAIGVNHLGPWFLDLYAILASNDALARGLDPYVYNPLDVFGRPHAYSHWWLMLGEFGLTRGDVLWLGTALGGAFVVAALVWLRPRQPGEVIWSLLVLLSPPMLLALNRANNDLVIFVLLAPVVPCLLSARPWVQSLAVPLLVGAVALKSYPAIALAMLLSVAVPHARRRLALGAAVVLLIMLPDHIRDLGVYVRKVPEVEGLMTFGARHLWVGLNLPAAWARIGGAMVGAVALAVWWRRDLLKGWVAGERAAWLSFVLGALLLTGCFFAGVSYAYRWVFALWLVPLLWRLPRDHAAPVAARRLAGITAALLLWALWADAAASSVIGRVMIGATPERVLEVADRFSYLEQPLIWALVFCLLAFVAHFAREVWERLRTGVAN